jgi:hypothetical protein
MFYEKMTKHKTQVNTAKYKDDIKKIINAMLKEEKTFEHYDFFKEDYDIFINSVLGKLIALNTIPIMIEIDEPLLIDKTIFIQKNRKSVVQMMIQKEVEKQAEKEASNESEKVNVESKESKHVKRVPKKKKLKLDI